MRRAYAVFVCLLLGGAELPLAAQIGYPGQYPPGRYPGGGYPPGTYPPGGGTGIPFPRGGKSKKTDKDAPIPTKSIEGMLRKMDDKLLVLESPDSRIISIKRSSTTKFLKDGEAMKPGDLKPGDHLTVDVTEDDSGYYYAATVNFEKAGTAAERAKASEPVELIDTGSGDDRPVQRRNANDSSASDDPDRPVLRRKDPPPAETAKTDGQPPANPAPAAAPANTDTPAPAATAKAPAKADRAPEPPADAVPEIADIMKAPKPQQPAARDADDPGPPKLQRGRPARRQTSDSDEPDQSTQPAQVASAKPPASAAPMPIPNRPEVETATVAPSRPAPAVTEHHDAVIEKARDRAGEFTETLPNYVCQEFMARFVNTTHTINWQPQDVVSTEVVYENGKESYRNVTVNNKKVKGIEQSGGAWSTGEFGTVLVDLFSPLTSADFRYRRESAASGKSALVYDFTVDQPNSHWNIIEASQSYKPAYRGTVWIDKRTYRVLRIEMQASRFPEDFPLDKVESATDYDYVRFATEQQFLMPVHAETLSCQRGTNLCAMNKIDFRNYHKYTGESVITFGSDKAEPAPAPKK
jgi:hypothetical protein